MRVMLDWIDPSGFKSFALDTPNINFEPFTLLVGANASGKSNLFDLIRLFQGLSIGLTIPEILHGIRRAGREVWPGIRGHANIGFRNKAYLRPQLGAFVNGVEYTYGMEFMGVDWNLASEWLGGGAPLQRVFIEDVFPNQDGVAYSVDDHWEKVGDYIKVTGSHRSTLLGGPLPSPLADICCDPMPLRNFLQSSVILELSLARMREYAPPGSTVLGAEGDGLSAVLYHLVAIPAMKAELLDWLTELCAPTLRDLDFIVVEGTGDILFRLHEADGTTVTAQSVSDGTLRFLGLIAALWSVPTGSLICLEELEHGLHPARIDLLIELILQATEARNLQVIATTHSPRVLHALGKQSPELLENTLVFGRNEDAAGTITRRLAELPSFDDVLQNRGVEHLFTSRWMERAL